MQPTVIKLSGSLAQRFGREHVRYLESGTVHEAMQALKHTLDGFERAILDLADRSIEFIVFKNGRNITADDLTERGAKEIRVLPTLSGAKGGFFGAIVGAVLLAAAVFFTGGAALALVGGVMLLGGVMQMLSPQPNVPKAVEQEGNAPSYGFGGPVSTTAAGHPVAVQYGYREIGGAYISAAVVAERYA